MSTAGRPDGRKRTVRPASCVSPACPGGSAAGSTKRMAGASASSAGCWTISGCFRSRGTLSRRWRSGGGNSCSKPPGSGRSRSWRRRAGLRWDAASEPGAEQLPFSVAQVSPLERLLPDELFTGKVGEAVTFSAAANERENRQLLILPYGGNNLTGVAVKLPETLVDESGKAVPFTFRISRIEYARLPKPSPDQICFPDRCPL